MFQDILVIGLVNGSAYALLAIGFSLIFGVARIVNIAHTAFYMLAAYCLYALLVRVGLGVPLSCVVAVVLVTLLSVACYRLVIEPVRQHEAAVLIATIALALIFQETMLRIFGGSYLGIPSAIAGVAVAPVFVVDPFMWLSPLVTVLSIVVLGGLGSIHGSVIGALVIGYVEAITVFALPQGAYLKGAVALSIMVIVLLVRPEGLFGVAFEEER